MKVSHYFNTVDYSSFGSGELALAKNSLGNVIITAQKSQPVADFRDFDIAIIGVPIDNGKPATASAFAPDKIREQLLGLPVQDKSLKIVDFGNLVPVKSLKSGLLALRDIIGYLKELGITTIVLGGSQELTTGICEAYKNETFFSLSVIDAVLDVKKGVESFNSTNFLTRVFRSAPNLFQFSLLGYQRHLVETGLFKKTTGVNNNISLGQLREDFTEAESVLLNTDVLSFDFGAIKYSEAKGSKPMKPNGLRSEEACLLARYAGLSDRLKVFGLFESLPQEDETLVTGRLLAEIVWYFIEGYSQRNADNDSENTKIYRVEIDQLDKPLVFVENRKQNRWWYEIESIYGKKILVACSKSEYRKASKNEIPGKWLKYVQKTDEILK